MFVLFGEKIMLLTGRYLHEMTTSFLKSRARVHYRKLLSSNQNKYP